MGLEVWNKTGLIDREVGYYSKLGEGFNNIFFLTYDTKEVKSPDDKFKILFNKFKLPPFLYSFISPLLYYKQLKKCDIVKTNQFHGAWTGAIAKVLFPKITFVMRGGYIWGECEIERGGSRLRKTIAKIRDKMFVSLIHLALKKADYIFLTSKRDKVVLAKLYGKKLAQKVRYIYNCVDTDKFPNNVDVYKSNDPRVVTIIARLERMKNIHSLIEAVSQLPGVELNVIGSGSYKKVLENVAEEKKVKVNFIGSISNDDLPKYLHKTDIFAMPQLYGSGINKAILEAMACGNIVVASEIAAHRSVITNGFNGFLCKTDASSIRGCLEKVMSLDQQYLALISKNAVETVRSTYSMDENVRKELEIYDYGRG